MKKCFPVCGALIASAVFTQSTQSAQLLRQRLHDLGNLLQHGHGVRAALLVKLPTSADWLALLWVALNFASSDLLEKSV